MFYLPRICEHCLNPSCVASCPSGAMYKRAEDGIVLVDQDKCRGWRMCVSGCPYKKVYFNHRTGKAEKCTLLLPADRGGAAHRVHGDLRRPAAVHRAAAVRRRPGARRGVGGERDRPVPGATGVMLDPNDPAVDRRRAGRASPTNGWTPPAGPRCTRWPRPTASRCRCIRNTAPCRWSGTCRRSRRWSTRSAGTGTTGRSGQPVRRDRGAAHPGRIPGRAVHRRRHSRRGGRAEEAGRDALVHAGHHPWAGDPAGHPGVGGHEARS